jgi:membrane-anchored mycosin MYCP
MRKLARLALAVATVVATLALMPATPATASRAEECVAPGALVAQVPWTLQAMPPDRIWPFTTGQDIIVAVLDSGVDADHPQLSGRVMPGYDALAGGGAAYTDCLGTGTQVAGVIAAQPAGDVGFSGLAPGVMILPIRVVAEASSTGLVADPAVLANGIDAAVSMEADVIAISAVTYEDDERLRAAVNEAVRSGITVVAAVGDLGDASAPNPTPYPADYDGVIGVGAIDPTGARWSSSQYGSYVDLVAPGVDVLTLQSGSGMTQVNGTGVACGFVAAAAALVRARRDSSGADVGDVLLSTASPAAGRDYYGHGIVNPYAAVTNQITRVDPLPLPTMAHPGEPDNSAWLRSRDLALAGAGIAVLMAIAVIVGAYALPRGRLRFWRGTLVPKITSAPEPAEPSPPVVLFDEHAGIRKAP